MTQKAQYLIQTMQSYDTAREVIDWLKDNGYTIQDDTKDLAYQFISYGIDAPMKAVIDLALLNGSL